MFDDKQTPQPPNNLPTGNEPDDMFAGIDNKPTPSQVGEEAPNALDAGLLKPKTASGEQASEKSEGVPFAETIKTPPIDPSGLDLVPDQQPQAQPSYAMKEPVLGKILLLVFLLFVLVGLGFGGFWFYNNFILDKTAEANLPFENLDNTESLFPEDDMIDTLEPEVVESGNVALTDETEEDTNSISEDMDSDVILFGEPTDSDKDGLDDIREEELGTNPNNSDTDDDGLDDASEVLIWKTDPNNPDSDGDGYSDGAEIKAGFNPLGPGKIFDTEETSATTTPTTTPVTTSTATTTTE